MQKESKLRLRIYRLCYLSGEGGGGSHGVIVE